MNATTPSRNCARPEVTHSTHIPIGQILVLLPLLLKDGCQEWSQQSRCEEGWNCVPLVGFPGGSVVKNTPASAGDAGNTSLIPGWGRYYGEGNSNLL